MNRRDRVRGFTAAETFIVIFLMGIVFAAFSWGFFRAAPSASSARAWAEEMQYKVLGVNCMDAMASGGYVSCSVRVEGRPEPLAVDCHVRTRKCAIARIGRSN